MDKFIRNICDGWLGNICVVLVDWGIFVLVGDFFVNCFILLTENPKDLQHMMALMME